MDDELGPLLRAVLDEPVVVRFRHGLGEAQARLLDSLGATVVVDPDADRCVRFCGREECKVSARTNERVSAMGLGMASLASGGGIAWEPNWIDYRHSLVLVDKRRDLGEVPATCDACGCETDITPVPHSPKCPTLARTGWTRAAMLVAVEEWAAGHEDAPPLASDWTKETTSHPSARQAVVEFGGWTGFLEEAGFSASTPRRRGRRLGPPAPLDGRELLDRMDAGEPLTSESDDSDVSDDGLEEVAAVGQVAESGSAQPVGEPERAAVSSSPEPGPAQPVPSPEGDPHPTGGGARKHGRAAKWTRGKVIAAIHEVAEKVGRTPSGNDMRAAGYGGAYQISTFARLGTSWQELVREAGYEPRAQGKNSDTRPADGSQEPRPEDLGRTASWPAEEVLGAIRRWAAEHGHPPTSDEWTPRVDGYPSAATAARRFGSWADAVEKAGFDRPLRGGHTRQRVAGQARFDGNEAKADQAVDQSRELADKIRFAAAAFEQRNGGPSSEREPEAEDAGDLETAHSLRPVSSPAAGEAEAASRSDVLVRALALAARAFADAILEETV